MGDLIYDVNADDVDGDPVFYSMSTIPCTDLFEIGYGRCCMRYQSVQRGVDDEREGKSVTGCQHHVCADLNIDMFETGYDGCCMRVQTGADNETEGETCGIGYLCHFYADLNTDLFQAGHEVFQANSTGYNNNPHPTAVSSHFLPTCRKQQNTDCFDIFCILVAVEIVNTLLSRLGSFPILSVVSEKASCESCYLGYDLESDLETDLETDLESDLETRVAVVGMTQSSTDTMQR